MDSLHTIGFYVSAGLSVAGALLVALLPGRGPRGAALGLTGVGLAGIYLFLSAGFAAIVAASTREHSGARIRYPRREVHSLQPRAL